MLRWVHPPNHLLRPSNQPKSQGCFFGIQHAWKTWIKSCLQRISCKIFSKFFLPFLNICTIYILHWSDITLIIPELHRYQKLWIQQIGKYGKSFGSFQPEIWGHKEIPIFYNDLCLHKKMVLGWRGGAQSFGRGRKNKLANIESKPRKFLKLCCVNHIFLPVVSIWVVPYGLQQNHSISTFRCKCFWNPTRI